MIWVIGIGVSLGAVARFILGNLISRGLNKYIHFQWGLG